MKYEVKLVALANMSATVDQEATSQEEAEKLAVQYAKEGNVLWNYDGLSDWASIEVGE